MTAMCVIFNPTAGRGRAGRALEQLRAEVGPALELRPTREPGHAEELAYEAARAGVGVVAAAGGDGTVHEVANGLLRSGRPEVIFQVLALGSSNDYAYALEREGAGGASVRRVDVGVARRADGRQRYFVNCLGVGFNGAVTRQARRISWLRGLPLYGLALLRALTQDFACPPMRVTLDGQAREGPTMGLTVNLGRREGGFLLTPDALLGDGCFDYVHAGSVKRWELLRYLPGMVTGKLPDDHPQIRRGRCRAVEVQADSPLTVHLDGEFFCLPEDANHGLEVSLLPGALSVCGGGLKAVQLLTSGAVLPFQQPTEQTGLAGGG